MKSVLIVSLFTVLRLVIPLAVMLILGEIVRRHDRKTHALRGA